MQLVDSSTENHTEGLGKPVSGARLQTVSPSTSPSSPSTLSPSAAGSQEAVSAVSQEQFVGGQEGGYPVWRIACGDMINRDRCIAVYVDGGEVVVVGPPGESARLEGSQLAELRTALDEAAAMAER